MLIICWDFDGTLITSGNIYKDIFFDYIKKDLLSDEKKYDFFSSFFLKCGGKHPLNVFKELKENNFLKDGILFDKEKIDKKFNNSVKKNGVLLTDGILEILEKLSKNKNIIMSIVTSTNIDNFLVKFNSPSLKCLKKYFQLDNNIYICEEVGSKEPKPNSNGYVYAINDILLKNNISKEKNIIIAIEDSISGCISACNAKNEIGNNELIVVGYNVINLNANKELIKNGVDYVFSSANDLFNFIEEMNNKNLQYI